MALLPTSVVVVDDHVLIAKAITGIIDSFPAFKVLYEAENGLALIEKFKEKKHIPEIVLLDISMPLMDGFATAKWLKENHPEVKVVALSMQDDDRSLIRMIQNGAKGYLLKNVHPKELESALQTVLSKGFYYPDWATSILLENVLTSNVAPEELHVTEREKEFLRYAATELTYKEIAEKMFCSPRTVEGYRDALFEKLRTNSRVALVVFAIKNGWVKV